MNAGLVKGQTLQNRYRVVSQLGRGGMGAVYRAWDTRLRIQVALKEMRPQPGLNPQMLGLLRQQFQQEATVLARLKHPHLVNVTDFFRERENDYLVMELVQGESLADRIARKGPLPEKHVLHWAHQLLQALGYCHQGGIIHRDVKPPNVIIDRDGRAVLVDFGLVKLWDPRDPHTRTVMRGMGTPQYAPPEQYDLAAGHTDARADIYSLGATLYHALSGRSPPTATQRVATRAALRPPRELNPSVSPTTERTVLRAMELVADDRFSSAREMATALTRQPSTQARPATRPKRRTRQRGTAPRDRTAWWVAALGGLAVLFLCGVVAVVSMMVNRLQAERGVSVQATAAARARDMTVTAAAVQALATSDAVRATDTAIAVQATAAAAQVAQTTATARAEATAAAVARVEETVRAASHWPLVLNDTFSSNDNGWHIGDRGSEWLTGWNSFTNDKYRWSAAALKPFSAWNCPDNDTSVYDFYLTVEARRVSGATNGRYGLVFQYDEPDSRGVLLISDEGAGSFSAWAVHAGEWTTLIKWTKSQALRPGEVNRLTVISEGSHYIFLVNDQIVGEADYGQLTSGTACVTIGLQEAEDSAVFEFDNFELRAP